MALVRLETEQERHHRDVVDRWFRALDQLRIRTPRGGWVVQVSGIHLDGQDVWIQMAGAGAGTLVLHIGAAAPIEQAITAMQADSPRAGTYPRLISAIRMPRAREQRAPGGGDFWTCDA